MIYRIIGTFVIAAFALAGLTIPGGPASAIVNLAVVLVTSTIAVTSAAAFVQLWRIPAIDSTPAGPVLRRMHNGGQRIWAHRRVAVPVILVGALLLPYGLEGAVLAAVLYAAGRAPAAVPGAGAPRLVRGAGYGPTPDPRGGPPGRHLIAVSAEGGPRRRARHNGRHSFAARDGRQPGDRPP